MTTLTFGCGGSNLIAHGTAGTWRIEVRMESTTGTFNFRVQKTT